jgi:hypothetical protein
MGVNDVAAFFGPDDYAQLIKAYSTAQTTGENRTLRPLPVIGHAKLWRIIRATLNASI